MEVTEFQIAKRDLERIPRHRLKFLVTAAHVANELNVLRNIMVFEGARDDEKSEFVKSLTSVRYMTLARIALGKVHEFHNCLQGQIGIVRSAEGDEAAEAFRALMRKNLRPGTQPEWVTRLRDKLTFHYDFNFVGECWDKLPAEAVLSFFLSEAIGHTSFVFAEQVVSMPFFEELGTDAQSDIGASAMMKYLSKSISAIVAFINDYLGQSVEDSGLHFEQITGAVPEAVLFDPDKSANPLLIMRRDT